MIGRCSRPQTLRGVQDPDFKTRIRQDSHILNKPDRIRTTVLFKFPDQDQDFQISFLEFDANTIIKRIFASYCLFYWRYSGSN